VWTVVGAGRVQGWREWRGCGGQVWQSRCGRASVARQVWRTQHPDALEQHLALLLAHPNLPRRLRQLPQPREHVLRLVDDRVEGKHLPAGRR